MWKITQYLLISLIIIIEVINNLFFPIPTLVICFFIAAVFLIIDKSLIIGLFVMLIPICSGNVLYFLNVIFMITLIIKYFKNIKINFSILLILIISIFESIHIFINIYNGYYESVIYLIGFILCLFSFGIITSTVKYFDKIKSFYFFVAGYITFSIITAIKYYKKFGTFDTSNTVKRFGFAAETTENDPSQLLINPNTIGVYSAFIIIGLLVLIYFKKTKVNFLNILILAIAFFIGMLTVSRTFILILLICLGILIIINLNKKYGYLFIICVTTIVILLWNSSLVSNIKSRIFDSSDISGSRFGIYSQYINVFLENNKVFLFGVGMQDYTKKIQKYNLLVDSSTHNLELECITIWGIMGLITVLILFMYVIFQCANFEDKSLKMLIIKILPLVCIFISTQFGQYFISYYHTFGFTLLGILFLDLKKEIKYD
ncbi:O-antigen ligase family protein [Staphylococcus hominis]